MSRTIDTVPHRVRKLILEGLSRVSSKETVEFLDRAWVRPGAPGGCAERSRQAFHARFSRALSTALASCMILASEDERFEDLVFDPDFCRLRPTCADVYRKAEFLLTQGHSGDPLGWKRLWDRASKYFIVKGQLLDTCSSEALIVMYNMLCPMGSATILLGEKSRISWRETWVEAERRGVLENPYLRLVLASLGPICGESDAYRTWLMDEHSRRYETVDLLTIVRRDYSEELNALLVRLVRGDLPTPRECLLQTRPSSTLSLAIKYIARTTRMTRHFSQPTQILVVLYWAEIVADLYAEWRGTGLFGSRGRTDIERAFAKLERAQMMEKNRFFDVAEALPQGQLRTRLFELWEKAYS